MTLRARIYRIIECSDPDDWKGQWFDCFMIVLIITNVLAVILETVAEIAAAYATFFYLFELFSVSVFTVEYGLRMWSVVENQDEEGFRHPVKGRIKYAMTPMALIDLMAIAPFFLAFIFSADLRFMRIFRLLRLLKLTRYSTAIHTLWAALMSQRRALGAALVIIFILLVFSSSIIFLMEKEAQPEAFSSIPAAMWWGLATLTTVGYGDITPVTAVGKVFGAFIMVLGVGMFALPAGILATGFSNEIRKREFVVTWNMVAAVPFFATLDAMRISEIANLLEIRMVPPRHVVVHKGDKADSMCFISSGTVSVDVGPEPHILGAGDFFGEIALLKDCERTATVTTITECQLLVLSVENFNRLLKGDEKIQEALTQTMEERLAELENSDRTS